ncbi:MAG: DNA polymerase III subunit delta', partial [Gammaproteobacteria bacterium]|nr:DNA polymerase III subunit delta' [Gemmatimonadota bacterium]NIR40440.1 DNA polymerase III subunit delta' [Actinomycetota bacterium]NIU78570.1 DNA polymerase III subunit delta' [Gammaproteobacteria bacterium]NIW31910.1 DNA polymerase III subunit delta' [Actinomycetota bacterium]
RSLASSAPAMGPRKILIIGRAEALVSQAGSPEAANALLKLLEEPPADTTVILTSDVP